MKPLQTLTRVSLLVIALQCLCSCRTQRYHETYPEPFFTIRFQLTEYSTLHLVTEELVKLYASSIKLHDHPDTDSIAMDITASIPKKAYRFFEEKKHRLQSIPGVRQLECFVPKEQP